jgi:amidophosphoribosyltransferase
VRLPSVYVTISSLHRIPLSAFDTSCFSGRYVTGERIGDDYFARLYGLRNEEAKKLRSGSAKSDDTVKAEQSNEGCESVNNDMRLARDRQSSCESLSNQA